MKSFVLAFMLLFVSVPVMAQDKASVIDSWLKPVESQYVCMVNNQSYDKPQILVDVEEKSYYGCCAMCKTRLLKDPDIRAALDPVSGNIVDKALAVIGTSPDRGVYYFENEDNFQEFAKSPMPSKDVP